MYSSNGHQHSSLLNLLDTMIDPKLVSIDPGNLVDIIQFTKLIDDDFKNINLLKMRRDTYEMKNPQVHPEHEMVELKTIPASSNIDETNETNSFCFQLREVFKKKDHDPTEKQGPPEVVTFASLFRFANATDFFYMIIGSIAALAHGAAFPLIVGCATIVVGYFQVAFWSIACERQTRRLRENLLRSILSKEIAYFDTNKTAQLNTRLSEDVNKVHDGTGDKVGSALQFFASFIAGLILGLIKGWKLTLVILSVSPVLFFSAVLFTKITATMTSQELKAYAKAGAIAEEVFGSIRTVFSFNGGAYESKRYEKHLQSAKISGIRKGGLNGGLMGAIWFLVFCTYALGFWYGAKLVREDGYSIGGILIVFFSIITAVFSLGQAAPHLQSVAQARGAAYTLWKIIDTRSKITINNPDGVRKNDIVGDIRFSNVHFSYPSRPDVSILNGLSFMAQRGETTALVGSSGCGKVTILN
ncbi:unnamed protein product [Rotaria socialis]|uniref:ABC transmembrane type-1 domain-containing protein n=1 Tax=Rotaria socialis TaxID=392032 RepID=A0A818UJI0_9BILA|nr:unnamed protein product [Rotaria socialis]